MIPKWTEPNEAAYRIETRLVVRRMGCVTATYMLWDMNGGISIAASEAEHGHDVSDATFEVLDEILRIDHIACQESALHGLGHLGMTCSEKAVPIIDEFLAREPNARPELIEYARHARTGYIK